MSQIPSEQLALVLNYHERTKHSFQRYAEGPGRLDWVNQPDPYRRYHGAELIELPLATSIPSPDYYSIFNTGMVAPQDIHRESISCLFRQSFALSAQKQAGTSRWALRVNPSSGNLHPTEAYLLCDVVPGLSKSPMVSHYSPQSHSLEKRCTIPDHLWLSLTGKVKQPCLLVGLTSLHWREAWKYGERAYRYCQHDVGHAIACVSLAAASLGWQCRLLDGLSHDQLQLLMGLPAHRHPDVEQPGCLLLITRSLPGSLSTIEQNQQGMSWLSTEPIDSFAGLTWQGQPNALSPEYMDWPIIDEVAMACEKPVTSFEKHFDSTATVNSKQRTRTKHQAHTIFQQRRSAVAMDGISTISAGDFFELLSRLLPNNVDAPFNSLSWHPRVHLLLFVHRVKELNPGLYLLPRSSSALEVLSDHLQTKLSVVKDCPKDLPLYALQLGDAKKAAEELSCGQAIAADGCFSLGMLTEFENPLTEQGPWIYPRLFWECGLIGQVLYLEAENLGLRGTGIGCFLDDPVHDLIGLNDRSFQSLYHFTLGGHQEDDRLTTLPPYSE